MPTKRKSHARTDKCLTSDLKFASRFDFINSQLAAVGRLFRLYSEFRGMPACWHTVTCFCWPVMPFWTRESRKSLI